MIELRVFVYKKFENQYNHEKTLSIINGCAN